MDIKQNLKKIPSYLILFLIGSFYILSGLFIKFIFSDYKTVFGLSMIGSILYGLMFLIFGFFVKKRSTKVLLFAIILFSIDGIGYLIAYLLFLFAGTSRPTTLLLFYILIHVPLIQKMIEDYRVLKISLRNKLK